MEYDPKVTPWQVDEQDFPDRGSSVEKMRFLLRYAILAPSSHNTQPWKFAVGKNEIRVHTDPTRWLKVADRDQRELHISVGCALENLLVAAEHFGYRHRVTYFPEIYQERLVATVNLTPEEQISTFREPSWFDAIPNRCTNHQVYDARPIPQSELDSLQECCDEEEFQLHLTDDSDIKRKVDDLIIQADAIQFADPAWREELGYWIGQGVFGTPWLMAKMGQLAVTYLNMGKGTAKKDSEVLMSAPVLGVISSATNDRTSQIKAGQVLERLWLKATSLGIRLHPMSQILQIPELKGEVAKLIPATNIFPQQTFRLGYAEPEKEHTPRRPLEEVIV